MTDKMLSFGWGAPSFAEQLPQLSPEAADKADAFNKAILLLAVHGVITEAERDRAIKRATREIGADLRKSLLAARASDERAKREDAKRLSPQGASAVPEGQAPLPRAATSNPQEM